MTNDTNFNFFPGFAWAVPRAFADPLSACRFEQGDLLFDRPEAYGLPWSEARQKVGHAVQIQEPSRGVAAKSSGQDDSAFADSWQQKVVFQFFDLPSGQSQTITTTQGRLYSLLWRGEQNILEESTKAPAVPLQAVDLKRVLPEVSSRFQTELVPDPDLIRFLQACDVAAGLYHEKYLKVKKKLETEFQTTVRLEPGNDLGLGSEFLPTVHVASFEITGTTRPAVEEALQSVLYKPGSERKTSAVRFRLSAHGVLL
jgi:hypothetical protein